jgi:hypothetical protein
MPVGLKAIRQLKQTTIRPTGNATNNNYTKQQLDNSKQAFDQQTKRHNGINQTQSKTELEGRTI